MESVQREIDDLAQELEAKQSLLSSLKARAQEQIAAEKALREKEEKLLALEQENAAQLLELEALRAEIAAARVA